MPLNSPLASGLCATLSCQVHVDITHRYTWYTFSNQRRSPEEIKSFKKYYNPSAISSHNCKNDNGTKFKNQVLQEYFNSVGISHQASSVRTPQQNGVVERRNWTLVEAARTMIKDTHSNEHFRWNSILRQKAGGLVIEKVRQYDAVNCGSRICGFIRLLCPSHLDTDTPYPATRSNTQENKHIAVRYHFIKEHVEKGTIELYFVKIDYQLANLLTKSLPVDRFNYLVRHLGMRSLSPQELERLAKSY
ncbi:retrovirus-related pol polyprotein from transposon TNT 1-94 [Tanacetum coccineum]